MTHLLIIGGGPAGTQAATVAAAKGARVTLVEKDLVGGAAHLLDCIPSKTMAASALRYSSVRNAAKLGMMGDAGAIDTIAKKMKTELSNEALVLATGGLAPLFAPLCEQVDEVDEMLTLDGIRLALGVSS